MNNDANRKQRQKKIIFKHIVENKYNYIVHMSAVNIEMDCKVYIEMHQCQTWKKIGSPIQTQFVYRKL